LPGLISRCVIPLAWASSSASATSMPISTISGLKRTAVGLAASVCLRHTHGNEVDTLSSPNSWMVATLGCETRPP
jgi:hypothetical protein